MKLLQNNTVKYVSLIVFATVIICIAAQSGFCDTQTAEQVPAIAEQVTNTAKHDTIVKFIIAMVGVMLSSVVIFVGLLIYNKFFVDKRLFPSDDKDDVLNTPQTVEQAVTFFIKRNKLC